VDELERQVDNMKLGCSPEHLKVRYNLLASIIEYLKVVDVATSVSREMDDFHGQIVKAVMRRTGNHERTVDRVMTIFASDTAKANFDATAQNSTARHLQTLMSTSKSRYDYSEANAVDEMDTATMKEQIKKRRGDATTPTDDQISSMNREQLRKTLGKMIPTDSLDTMDEDTMRSEILTRREGRDLPGINAMSKEELRDTLEELMKEETKKRIMYDTDSAALRGEAIADRDVSLLRAKVYEAGDRLGVGLESLALDLKSKIVTSGDRAGHLIEKIYAFQNMQGNIIDAFNEMRCGVWSITEQIGGGDTKGGGQRRTAAVPPERSADARAGRGGDMLSELDRALASRKKRVDIERKIDEEGLMRREPDGEGGWIESRVEPQRALEVNPSMTQALAPQHNQKHNKQKHKKHGKHHLGD